MEAIQCRYCKQTGHYKNKCPKLAGKPQQPRRYNNNRDSQNNFDSRKPAPNEIKPDPTPSKPKFEDEFPSLGEVDEKKPSAWGDKKSFASVISEPVVVEEVKETKEDDDYSGFVTLGVITK